MALTAVLRDEHIAKELLDGIISRVYSQVDLDEVRRQGRALGGIPVYLESKLHGSGVKVLMADMTKAALEVMGGSYYMREQKVILLNPSDKFYIGEDGETYEIPLALVLYHELGHAHQYIIDGFSPDMDTDKIEHDNIVRHEWPMCDRIGIPRRKHYNLHWGRTRQQAFTNSIKIRTGATASTIMSKLPAARYL